MAETFVYKLKPQEAENLRAKLNEGDFEFRRLNHAKFQVRADGLTASMYNSGKLVVQGKNAEAWCVQYIGVKPISAESPLKKTSTEWPEAVQAIGSDEAGKGDSFGGLVVCAVGLTAENHDEITSTTICDSKQMNDNLILQLAPWLKERVAYHEINLFPREYNEQWLAHGSNVNTLLTDMHAGCIKKVAATGDYKSIVIDRFSPRLPVTKKLKTLSANTNIIEQPRAEEFLPVACASVIARATFLEQIKVLSQDVAIDIPLGSGRPVAAALENYRAVHGNGNWHQAVKVHFKNIQKFIC